MAMKRGRGEKAGCRSWAIKPGGGKKQSDRTGGAREGCRRGVKTHLCLDGCEFRPEREEAWEHSRAEQ